MLSYGVPADFMDQYIRIGESTVIESLRRFVIAVVEVFGEKYLRSPNENDTSRLLAIGQRRGFPGMLGSLDCMHWRWKNCPNPWRGQYTGHEHEPSYSSKCTFYFLQSCISLVPSIFSIMYQSCTLSIM